jgi:hypothetical protein
MQLHPFLATISRPIYHDREGNLYTVKACTECEDGQVEVYPANPDERCYWETCQCCGGGLEIYEDISEDEIINS